MADAEVFNSWVSKLKWALVLRHNGSTVRTHAERFCRGSDASLARESSIRLIF